jgi:hypothetical protein
MIHLQLAIGGAWERALVLRPGASTLDDAQEWLAAARQAREGAVEIVLAARSRRLLTGVRLRGERVTELEGFIRLASRMSLGIDLSGAIDVVQRQFGASAFAPAAMRSLDLGVFNAWRSQPVQRLWTSGGGALDPARVVADAMASPDWRARAPAPLLLEAAWTEPVEHWAGVTVSRKREGAHRPVRALLLDGVSRLAGR